MSQDKENLDDIFEATFGQRVDMRQARELKRMKMRHARQDAAAKVKEIQSEANEPAVVKLNPKKKIEYKITDHLGRELNKDGTLKVAEAKLDPVDQKELKGKHADRKDKDIDNDGDSDKTDEYLHNRRKAIKHAMAKKMKEEAEQIDEISAKTIDKYREQSHRKEYPGPKGSKKYEKRAKGSTMAFNKLTGRAKVPATMEEVEQVDEGRKPSFGAAIKRAEKSRQRAIKKAGMQAKRMGGSDEAVKNAMRDHDVFSRDEKHVRSHLGETATAADKNQIDEISKATMGRYINKAKDAIDAASWKSGYRSARPNRLSDRDDIIKAKEKLLSKRHKGIETAVKKLTREEAEQIDELSNRTLGSYVKKAKKELSSSDYHVGRAVGARETGQKSKTSPELERKLANRGKKRYHGIDKAVDKMMTREEAEQIDEISGKTLASYSDKVARYGPMKDVRTRQKHEKGLYTAYKKMKAKGVKVPARMEEAEQIDELSGATLGSYVAKSRKDEADRREKGIKTRDEIRKQTGLRVGTPIDRKLYSPTASRGAGQKMAVKKLTGQARVNANEEVELEEARGRPRKDAQKDYTIHPKTKEKLMHNNPAHMTRINNLYRTGALKRPKTEAGQNIVTQLRKASLSMRGGEKVNFTHGASTHVSAAHAQKILDKHAGMKPAEKEKFQKEIGHSHAMLKKHV